MKEIYISCGSIGRMTTRIKDELRSRLKNLGFTVISDYKSLILPDLANIYFIFGTLSETNLNGLHADLLFYKYGDLYFNENASQHFKTCVLYDDTEVISRYIDSIIREDISDRCYSLLNYKVKEAIKETERKPLIFDHSRMQCVCPRCERITDAPWDDSENPFYCRYCGQKIIFPVKEN